MPPKPDAAADAKYLFMKVTGGDPAPPSVLAPKLGPLGMVSTPFGPQPRPRPLSRPRYGARALGALAEGGVGRIGWRRTSERARGR